MIDKSYLAPFSSCLPFEKKTRHTFSYLDRLFINVSFFFFFKAGSSRVLAGLWKCKLVCDSEGKPPKEKAGVAVPQNHLRQVDSLRLGPKLSPPDRGRALG